MCGVGMARCVVMGGIIRMWMASRACRQAAGRQAAGLAAHSSLGVVHGGISTQLCQHAWWQELACARACGPACST